MDDGFDMIARMPAPKPKSKPNARNIEAWIKGTQTNDAASTALTANAMSFFDDGADLVKHKTAAPGFGEHNSKYYKHRNKSKREPKVPFNEDVRRAVSGQIKGTLEGMRGLAGVGQRVVEVRQEDIVKGKEEKGEKEVRHDKKSKVKQSEQKKDTGPPPGACRIYIPPPPPNFIIHGEAGRLIVVDSSKEPIDSRPPPELMPRLVMPEREPEAEWKEAKHMKTAGSSKRGKERDDDHTKRKDSKAPSSSQSSWNLSQASGQKPQQTPKISKAASKPRSNASSLKHKTASGVPLPSNPDFFMSGGLFGTRAQSSDSWEDGQGTEIKSNYMAPTVESASDSPSTELCTYMIFLNSVLK
jgi:hypothetical protein